MRPGDGIVFRDAAKTYRLWILVRRINKSSMPYIGRAGYCPKRIDCKAKTASRDCDGHDLAGLVAVPGIHPQAFVPGKLLHALRSWYRFLVDRGLIRSTKPTLRDQGLEESRNLNAKNGPYSVDLFIKSKHFGCLKLNNQWIHGDYDLKDIVVPGQERRNIALVEELHGQPHMRGPKLPMVQDYVNRRLGVPMVQHGAQAQYTDHADERIDVFGPNGEQFTLKNAKQTKLWYEKMQRQTLTPPGASNSQAGNGAASS